MKPNRTICLLCGAALMFLVSSCLAPATFHTAKPIKKGKFDIGIASHGWGTISDGGSHGDPGFEAQFRYGVAKWFDFGLKVYPLGAQGDFNFCIINSKSFSLSIDPTFAFHYWWPFHSRAGNATYGAFYLPVLMDVLDTGFVTLTTGPKPMVMVGNVSAIHGGTGNSGVGWFVIGGMFGVKLQFTPLFSLMVEGDAFFDPVNVVFMWDGGVSFNFTF